MKCETGNVLINDEISKIWIESNQVWQKKTGSSIKRRLTLERLARIMSIRELEALCQ